VQLSGGGYWLPRGFLGLWINGPLLCLRFGPGLWLSLKSRSLHRVGRGRPVSSQGAACILAACTLLYLLNGAPGGYDAATSGLAANGFGDHSPGKYSMAAALVAEITLTFIFVMVIVGVTSKNATPMLAGAAIGLALTLVHLIGIPITNLSVNPARSTGPALFVGGWAISQLWLFWIAPIIGGACAGFVGRWLFADDSAA